MTRKAEQFIAANARSPVVHRSLIEGDRGRPHGYHYRLEDRSTFRLTRRDLDALRGVHSPRWLQVA